MDLELDSKAGYEKEAQEAKDDETKEVIKEHQFSTDFGRTFSTPHGKRVLWSILTRCRVFQEVVQVDPHMMYHREGERNIGLWFLTHCSNTLIQELIGENFDKKED